MRAAWSWGRSFWQEHRWLLLAMLLFIAWKFLLLGLMWQDRALPPEPDDSLIYSGHIYSVLRCATILCDYPGISLTHSSGYIYFSYRVLWGLVSKLFSWSALHTFEFSFYAGTVGLVVVLAYLITQLTADRGLRAVALLGLALFYGGGLYHGFYWVVPSFFSLLFLLLLLAVSLDRRWRGPGTFFGLAALAVVLVFTHPSGFYFLGILPLFAGYVWLFDRLPPLMWRKVLATTLVGGLVYVAFQVSLVNSLVPDSFQVAGAERIQLKLGESFGWPSKQVLTGDLVFDSSARQRSTSGWRVFRDDYLKYLFPVWPAIGVFVIAVSLLAHYGARRLLELYLAALTLTVVALFHPTGYRMLLILWLVTFLLYTAGFWYAWRFVRERLQMKTVRTAGYAVVAVLAAGFVLINVVYSLAFSLTLNQNDAIVIPPEVAAYVLERTASGEPVFPHEKLSMAYLSNTELISRPQADERGEARYAVEFVNPRTTDRMLPLDYFFTSLSWLFTGRAREKQLPASASPPGRPAAPAGHVLEAQFGDVRIYRNVSYASQ